MPTPLEAALSYAERGWPVIPLHTPEGGGCSCRRDDCGSIGKHPRTLKGLRDATLDPAKIREWWRMWPTANVAIATGAPSGLVVIDIDPRHGGFESMAELEAHGSIPSSVEAITGGGGRHILLAHPGGYVRGDNRGRLGAGVDVKADGGYIAVAPSIHASGRRYEWEASSEPDEVELAPTPPWLLALLGQGQRDEGGRLAAPVSDSQIPEGGRSNALTSLAGTMRRRGMAPDEIAAALLVVNARRCSPPMPEGDVRAIAASVGRYEPSAPVVSPAGQVVSADVDPRGFFSLVGILRDRRDVIAAVPRFDDLLFMPTVDGRPVDDAELDEIRLRIEALCMDAKGRGLRFRRDDVQAAVYTLSKRSPYNPVADYLNGLAWDGTPRLADVAERVLGVAPTPLTLALLRRWFVSAVARILRPGCKVDTVLILHGPQGIRKSTFFKVLAGEWFSDDSVDLASKDALLLLQRVWIIEWAELDAMMRARDANAVKAFLSRSIDTFRPPYGRSMVDAPRHSVIVGTTNEQEILADGTGNRRYWVLRCGSRIDTELLAEWRDQIWAEAVAAFRAGEVWHLSEEESALLEASQAEYHRRDPWEGEVLEWAASRAVPVTTEGILEFALERPRGQWTISDQRRVASILRSAGWSEARMRVAGTQRRYWTPPCDGCDGSVTDENASSVTANVQSLRALGSSVTDVTDDL